MKRNEKAGAFSNRLKKRLLSLFYASSVAICWFFVLDFGCERYDNDNAAGGPL